MADATVPNDVNPETWKQIQLHESIACNRSVPTERREDAMRKLATAYKGADRLEARKALMMLANSDDVRASGYALCMLNKHFNCNHKGQPLKTSAKNPYFRDVVGNGGRKVVCPSYSA